MSKHRPILISVMQFDEPIKQGQMTVFDLIDTARRLGVDGVELRREWWPEWQDQLAAARQYIEESGLLVTYASFVTLFSENNEDQATLRQDIDAAAALGAPQLRVFLGPAPALDDEASWEAGRRIVEYAASQGVVIALENFARTPGGTLAEIQQTLQQIPHNALKINVDIGNYVLHGQDVPAAIRALGDRIVSAHLKDQPSDLNEQPTYLGGGGQDLPAIFAEFERLPQPIIYCYEFGGSAEDMEQLIQRSQEYLRSL